MSPSDPKGAFPREAPCGCHYRTVGEYGSRGEPFNRVDPAPRWSDKRCEQHRSLDDYDLAVRIASPHLFGAGV